MNYLLDIKSILLKMYFRMLSVAVVMGTLRVNMTLYEKLGKKRKKKKYTFLMPVTDFPNSFTRKNTVSSQSDPVS